VRIAGWVKPASDKLAIISALLLPEIVFSASGRNSSGKSGGAVSQSVMKKLPNKLAPSIKTFFQFSALSSHSSIASP
jgi:hypothetical protein